MKLPNFVTALAFVACVVLLVALLHSRQQLALARAQAASLQASNKDLSERLAKSEASAVDPAILKRLEADRRETIKLRGEVAGLKSAVAEAEKKAATAPAASAAASQQLQTEAATTNRFARVHERKLTATVPLGHGLIFGGWQSAANKQTFAMAVPRLAPGTTDQIELQTRWIDLSDEALKSLDPGLLVRAAGQHTSINPEQLAVFIKSAEDTTGVDLITMPAVTTISGRQARVSVSESRTMPDGTMVEFGPTMDVLPTIGADGSVDLVVDAKLTLPTQEWSAAKE